MADGVFGLQGKSRYNNTPYTVNVNVVNGKVREIVTCGKPHREVLSVVDQMSRLIGSSGDHVLSVIEITMRQVSEYVQKVRR